MKHPDHKDEVLNIVGSTIFGRYPKISVEQTFNMIISDNWLVPYAGYSLARAISGNNGRGIYSSSRSGKMYAVVDDIVYSINNNLFPAIIGSINTSSGDVFIAENNGNQIAFCDQADLYIYNYDSSTFLQATLPPGIIPGYVDFQNGRFIVTDTLSNNWYLSELNNGLNWFPGPGTTTVFGSLQTKPDFVQAAVRFPGLGNLLIVFGNTVAEYWNDIGTQIFPYRRTENVNIDYGCLNRATIAAEENIVCWLGQNENSGPVIIYSDGSHINRLSTDGIDFKLSKLKVPQDSFAFFFKQDGHLLYQITFFDPQDNFTLIYDFTTQKFFTLTDEYMNYHIAKRVAFFNETYYFVSTNDGNIYELSTNYTAYNGNQIPRVRTCKNFRLPDSSRFVVPYLTFTMEQGQDVNYLDGAVNNVPRVDLSVSYNGGESFSSYISEPINKLGYRQNQMQFYNLGVANDFVPQFRFWSTGRIVATNGLLSYYQ